MIGSCSLLVGLAMAALLPAQESPEPPELDFDFAFEEEDRDDVEGRVSLPIRGAFTLETARGTGASPRWHKAGPKVTFVGDWGGRLGQLFGEATLRYNHAYRWENDSKRVVDARSVEGVVRELHWKKSFERWSVTLGNAIVVWGEGDILTPSDVVTRRDASLVLIEYPAASRLGQNLVRLGFYPTAEDQLEFLVVPKALSDRIAPEGHPDALFGEQPTGRAQAENDFEIGMRWNHRFPSGELAVQGGYFHERRGMFAPATYSLERSAPGYGFLGVSGHRALGPVVWRGELAFYVDRACQRWSEFGPAGFERRDDLSALIAADVTSSRWGRLSLEAGLASGNPHTVERGILTSLAANWLKNFLRDRMRIQTSVVWQDGFESFLARMELGYRLRDAWEIRGKLTSLDDGAAWGSFARQSRVELDVSYSFDWGR